jgi:hypothetical protein
LSTVKRLALTAHVAAGWVLVASVLGSALLVALDPTQAGLGGAIVGVSALLVVVTGVLAGVGVRRTAAAFGLLLLYFATESTPAALQPLLTLALFGTAVLYAERSTRVSTQPLVPTSPLSTGRGK